MPHNFQKNNLVSSRSSYLQQHKDDPVHWQEWSNEVLAYAKQHGKLILVSCGYATCHWCHVMAETTFQERSVADFLNEYYVAIKIDREQRPDLDQYFMSFMQENYGSGGWPLNVILSPTGAPFFAGTYFPAHPTESMPGFVEVLSECKQWFERNSSKLAPYVSHAKKMPKQEEHELLSSLKQNMDVTYGGLRGSQKFPPHSTLLFSLVYLEKHSDQELAVWTEKTLQAMALGGLHDHVQGGFFRYCVDETWTIPHFEKMLYDQAMHLWVYSCAYHLFKKDLYKQTAEKILDCLEHTLKDPSGLYYAGLDSDTNHEEGATYLWDEEEFYDILSDSEFEKLMRIYRIRENIEGKIHLTKKRSEEITEIEKKLLSVRKMRAQPEQNKNIITSQNALLGIAFIQAFRYLKNDHSLACAKALLSQLLVTQYHNDQLLHLSYPGQKEKEIHGVFLDDFSALLLFVTYLYEEEPTLNSQILMRKLAANIYSFEDKGVWSEAKTTDFQKIDAQIYDHPTPSARSLAQLALLRTNMLIGDRNTDSQSKRLSLKDGDEYQAALFSDFLNYTIFLKKAGAQIKAPHLFPWDELPLSAIQIHSDKQELCFQGTCQKFSTLTELKQLLLMPGKK